MSYIRVFAVTQLDIPAQSDPASLRIDWIYGDHIPEIVAIYVRGASDSHFTDPPLKAIKVDRASPQTSFQFTLPAGNVYVIGVAPRETDENGGFSDTTSVHGEEPVRWPAFLDESLLSVKAVGVSTPMTQPFISGHTVRRGSADIEWTIAGKPSFFDVNYGPVSEGAASRRIHKSRRTYTVHRIRTGTWQFSIRAGYAGWHLGSDDTAPRSAWDSVTFTIDDEHAWRPWTEGIPNAHVAVGEQASNGDKIILQVARDGRPHVSWPNDAGFFEPAPIGPPDVAPGGAGIALVRQTENQDTAVIIDHQGQLALYWVDGLHPWEGPARFGGGLVPGAPVALARQGEDFTVGATVDAEGAVCVFWTAFNEPWKGPARITPAGFTHPGASVALLRQSDDVVALMVVRGDGALCITRNGDPWPLPFPISRPEIFAPETGLALAWQAGDIAVGLAMGPELRPFLTVTLGGPWTEPEPLRSDYAAPPTGGVALGGIGNDWMNAAWFDDRGVLIMSGVVTGQPWQPGLETPFGAIGVPGGRLGMHDQTLAFVDPQGRLGIVQRSHVTQAPVGVIYA